MFAADCTCHGQCSWIRIDGLVTTGPVRVHRKRLVSWQAHPRPGTGDFPRVRAFFGPRGALSQDRPPAVALSVKPERGHS